MTERTVARQSLAEATFEDDDISLTSTVEEDANEDNRYNVVKILDEQMGPGGWWYLIQWEGYPITASTWEPRDNVESLETLEEWSAEKKRQARGISDPFNREEFNAAVSEEQEAKSRRHRLRREKRKRLGISAAASTSVQEEYSGNDSNKSKKYSNEANEGNENDTDHESASKSLPKMLPSLQNFIVDDEGDAVNKDTESEDSDDRPIQRRRRRAKHAAASEEEEGLSDDSLIREVKQNLKRKQEIVKRNNDNPINGKGQPSALKSKQSRGEKITSSIAVLEKSKVSTAPTIRESRMPVKARTEAPSSTGYTGTANRRGFNARGSAAIRGSNRGTPFNIGFTSHGAAKQRKNLAVALLHPPQNSRPFKTLSMMRKAELGGRNLADRPPDFNAIGPLYSPSEYKIRKKTSQTPREFAPSQPEPEKESPTLYSDKNIEAQGSMRRPSVNLRDDTTRKFPAKSGEIVSTESQSAKEQEKAFLKSRMAELEAANHAARLDISHATRRRDRSTQLDRLPTVDPRSLIQNLEDSNNPAFNDSVLSPTQISSHPTVSVVSNLQAPNPNPRKESSQIGQQPANTQRPKPVQRLSLDAYKTQQTTKILLENGIKINAIIGDPKSILLPLVLTNIDKNSPNSAVRTLLQLRSIIFDRMCLAIDFRRNSEAFEHRVFATGNVIADASSVADVETIADNLRLSVSSLACRYAAFTILLFPSKSEEWKFIAPQDDTGAGENKLLKYHIYGSTSQTGDSAPISKLSFPATIPLNTQLPEILNREILGLNYDRLIFCQGSSQNRKVNYFFLLFPSKAENLLKHIAFWLLSCNPNRQIFTSQQEGSWAEFNKSAHSSCGVIIIHQSLLPIISKIPNLRKVLHDSTFWITCEADENYPRFSKLFPHGGAVFLTPSFLTTQPKRTYQILSWFLRKLKMSTPGTWKLVGCFKLRQYLYDLALAKAAERQEFISNFSADSSERENIATTNGLSSQDCQFRFQICEIIEKILAAAGCPQFWDDDYPDEEISPIVYVNEDIHQNDEKRLVEFFAYWAISRLTAFRKFVVLGTSFSDRPRHAGLKTSLLSVPYGVENVLSTTASLEPSHMAKRNEFPKKRPRESKLGLRNGINASDVVEVQFAVKGVQPKLPEESDTSRDITWNQELIGMNKMTSAADYSLGDQAGTGSSSKQRIDENVPPSVLGFIAVTATDTSTARRYLAQTNGDVSLATKLYFSSNLATSLDGSDDSPFIDLIAGSEAVHRPQQVQTDLERAIELFKSPPPSTPFSPFEPSNHDGADGGTPPRPRSRSGIVTDNDGIRKVPSSIRTSGTTRPELNIRPGYVPLEDKEVYKPFHLRSKIDSAPQSATLSPASVQSPVLSSLSRRSSGQEGESSGYDRPATPNLASVQPEREPELMGYDFEPTTEWYRRLKTEGRYWEHIEVVGWKNAFKYLGVEV